MEKQQKIEIGRRIRECRKKKKLTMVEFGKIVNLHHSTISRYENGLVDRLDVRKLREFAQVLDVTPAFLMGYDNIEKPVVLKKEGGFQFYFEDFFKEVNLTDEEMQDLLDYANYIVSKRKDKD